MFRISPTLTAVTPTPPKHLFCLLLLFLPFLHKDRFSFGLYHLGYLVSLHGKIETWQLVHHIASFENREGSTQRTDILGSTDVPELGIGGATSVDASYSFSLAKTAVPLCTADSVLYDHAARSTNTRCIREYNFFQDDVSKLTITWGRGCGIRRCIGQ